MKLRVEGFTGRFSSKGDAKFTSRAKKRKQMVWEKDDDNWKRT